MFENCGVIHSSERTLVGVDNQSTADTPDTDPRSTGPLAVEPACPTVASRAASAGGHLNDIDNPATDSTNVMTVTAPTSAAAPSSGPLLAPATPVRAVLDPRPRLQPMILQRLFRSCGPNPIQTRAPFRHGMYGQPYPTWRRSCPRPLSIASTGDITPGDDGFLNQYSPEARVCTVERARPSNDRPRRDLSNGGTLGIKSAMVLEKTSSKMLSSGVICKCTL